MALIIREYTTNYGITIQNIYCKVYKYDYDITDRKVVFELRPYANKQMADNDVTLPINELILGGTLFNVEKTETNIIKKCYEHVLHCVEILGDLTDEEINERMSSIQDNYDEFLVSIRWKPFRNAYSDEGE